MKLKAQMFELIRSWNESKLFKKVFLADKNVSQGKFDYWLKKYHADSKQSEFVVKQSCGEDFKSICLPKISEEVELTKIIELRTVSGIELTIFEKC